MNNTFCHRFTLNNALLSIDILNFKIYITIYQNSLHRHEGKHWIWMIIVAVNNDHNIKEEAEYESKINFTIYQNDQHR